MYIYLYTECVCSHTHTRVRIFSQWCADCAIVVWKRKREDDVIICVSHSPCELLLPNTMRGRRRRSAFKPVPNSRFYVREPVCLCGLHYWAGCVCVSVCGMRMMWYVGVLLPAVPVTDQGTRGGAYHRPVSSACSTRPANHNFRHQINQSTLCSLSLSVVTIYGCFVSLFSCPLPGSPCPKFTSWTISRLFVKKFYSYYFQTSSCQTFTLTYSLVIFVPNITDQLYTPRDSLISCVTYIHTPPIHWSAIPKHASLPPLPLTAD